MNGDAVPYKVQMSMDFIREGISSRLFAAGSVLPTIKQLAGQAGVSCVTMWKAVQHLKKHGDLLTIPGQLIKVSGGPTGAGRPVAKAPAPAYRSSRQSWYRIKDELERNILTGAYDAGALLPSVKELGSRYRTSHHTIAKALNALCDERLIHASGRRYEAARLSHSHAHAAVCVLVDKAYLELYVASVPESRHDYLHAIEFHGAKARVRIQIAECGFVDNQLVPDDIAAAFPSGKSGAQPILGYIYLMSHTGGSTRMFQLLRARRKPVSVLDDNGSPQIAELIGDNRFFKVFSVGPGALPGRDIGRYLLNLGHTAIAYFSAFEGVPWSENRLQGLRDIYARAGYVNAVRSFTIGYDAWTDDTGAPASEPMTEGPKVLSGLAHQDVAQSVLDRRRRYLKEMNFGPKGNPGRGMLALFARALQDTRITAWVAANDGLASIALDFLHAKGVRVPQRISVVSFDDTPTAIVYRLTSYNFNLSAIAGAAFRHVLGSPMPDRRSAQQRVEMEGLVVERDTAAQVHR